MRSIDVRGGSLAESAPLSLGSRLRCGLGRAQTMVEYALLLSLVALALVGTIGGMAGQVGGRFNAISNTLASGGNGGLDGGGTTPGGGGGGTVTPPPSTTPSNQDAGESGSNGQLSGTKVTVIATTDGNFEPGEVLAADIRVADSVGVTNWGYQWKVDGKVLSNDPTFVAPFDSVGKKVTCVISDASNTYTGTAFAKSDTITMGGVNIYNKQFKDYSWNDIAKISPAAARHSDYYKSKSGWPKQTKNAKIRGKAYAMQLVDIGFDGLADGSGKAGFSFLSVDLVGKSVWGDRYWDDKTALRVYLNQTIYGQLENDVRQNIKTVKKKQWKFDLMGGEGAHKILITDEKIWLPSFKNQTGAGDFRENTKDNTEYVTPLKKKLNGTVSEYWTRGFGYSYIYPDLVITGSYVDRNGNDRPGGANFANTMEKAVCIGFCI